MQQAQQRRGARTVWSVVWLLALALAAPQTLCAQYGTWQAHTSMREVLALDAGADVVWAATSGGVFSYHPETGEVRTFTAAERLHDVSTQALAYDRERDVVWIGYRSGVIDRLDAETGAVTAFRDIARADRFPDRAVRRLVLQGDSLFAGTAFGLVLFNPERAEVRDSYTRFGSFPAGTAVNDVLVAPGADGRPHLWVATDEGVAHAPLDAPNLKVPASWTTLSVDGGRLGAYALIRFEGHLYAGTESDLWRLDDGAFVPTGTTRWPVYDLMRHEGRVLGAYRFGLVELDGAGTRAFARGDGPVDHPYRLAATADGTLWLGDRGAALLAVTSGTAPIPVAREVVPDGPYYNSFADLRVKDGVLWAAGGAGGGRGVYRLGADGGWANYNPRTVEGMTGVTTVTAVPGASGDVWVGTWGRGAVLLTAEGRVLAFDQTNSPMTAPPNVDDHYVIVESMAIDTEGRVWATNLSGAQPLQVFVPDGEPSGDDWTGLPSLVGANLTYGYLFIDAFGQKWVQVVSRSDLSLSPGVAVIDTGADPTTAADDAVRFFDEEAVGGVGLPSTHVNVVTEDRDGLIWVGTQEGPAYLFNTGVVAQDPAAQFIRPQLAERAEDESVFLLNGLAVYDIAVDPANRLWMGTEQGAYLVEPQGGGYRIVEHFTAADSPLFDDAVIHVAVDAATGRVYFATEQGLVSYSGSAVEPEEQAQDLFVYPNPVLLQDAAAPDVCVQGLVEATDVQVLTPDGALVDRSQQGSGRFCWQGADVDVWYRDVPSGVYIIAAVGQNGEGTAFGRVAVIR